MLLHYSSEFKSIFNELDHSRSHFFITGKAGTGKSTLLTHFRINSRKKIIVLAPTGLAALRVRGQTIHSFFRFRPGIIDPKDIKEIRSKALFRKIDTIIIDEVSMVRADVLDGIDIFLRKNGTNPRLPFGGMQMIFFGDLYQLPPVLNREEEAILQQRYLHTYFFGAHCMASIQLSVRELHTIYRQHDTAFIKILNHLREGHCNPRIIAPLASRVAPVPDDYEGIRLVPTNKCAMTINNRHLHKLPGEPHTYPTVCEGDTMGGAPVDDLLQLKPGAQVIFTRNDPDNRWVNGTLGEIVECKTRQITVKITTHSLPTMVRVQPVEWEKIAYRYNSSKDALEAHITGRIRQFPLRLAWAMTIHKSQGQTFEKVHIDMGQGMFSHGQLYVALSRCRSLAGTTLSRQVNGRDLQICRDIVDFYRKLKQH